jgi:hypothetical protein
VVIAPWPKRTGDEVSALDPWRALETAMPAQRACCRELCSPLTRGRLAFALAVGAGLFAMAMAMAMAPSTCAAS